MELQWRVNEKEGSFRLSPGCSSIFVHLDQGEVLKRAEAEIEVPAAPKMFFNGYQTWTHCPEYSPSDKIRGLHGLPKIPVRRLALDHFGDYHFVDYPNQRGKFHGVSYCYFRDGDHYRLFASLSELHGYTIFSYHADHSLLKIERDCIGTSVTEIPFPAFELFYAEGSEAEVFDAWFDALGIHNEVPPIKGYTSWYNHYQNINSTKISEDLAGARKLFEPGDLFQIDDGWEPYVGDWDRVNSGKFPNGLRPLVRKIHEAGFRAGLWLAPFVCEPKSRLFREHPDWLLRYNGKPWKNGPTWSGNFSLDIDNPAFVDYLTRVFKQIFEDWGFDLVKLDFLYGAAPLHTGDHGSAGDGPFTETRAARMIRAMRLLRELCRDKLILACGVPLMPAFGLVDYCRIGSDVSLNWDDILLMRLTHRERVSTRNSVDNTIYRRQLDGRAFGNDPDVFFLRDNRLALSKKEKEYVAVLDALFGSVWLTSDNLNRYDSGKTGLYAHYARLHRAKNAKIDPDTRMITFTLDGTVHQIPHPHFGR